VATFSVLSFAIGSLISGLFPTVSLSDIKRELALTPLWQIIFLGSLNLSGYTLMLKAFTLTEASNVIPIATATAPFVVLLSFFLLGEKDFLLRKFIAALITLGGIYLMR
jgi:drug/metabolite transporter (DMT)-like permease